MDYHGRRGRRGRCHSHSGLHCAYHSSVPPPQKTSSFLHSLYSFFIMCSLITVIYLMLEYHCQTCTEKGNISNITKNLEDIANNLAVMKDSYSLLETRIAQFSKELPKIEGQIEMLEALANSMEQSQFGWEPRTHTCLQNVPLNCAGDHHKEKLKSTFKSTN